MRHATNYTLAVKPYFRKIIAIDCDRPRPKYRISCGTAFSDQNHPMANAFFSDLLSTISERGRTLLRRVGSSDDKQDAAGLIGLCEALLSSRGEASGTAMAREVLDRYHHLDQAGRLAFFATLARDYGPDREKLSQAIETWRAQPSDDDASDLHFASEPRRQELIRRLNRAPGGTGELVAMRADLLKVLKSDKGLSALDRDIVHLLSSWFNRGFLVLRRIDWSSPPTSWKRSSATRRCMKSATGTICAAVSILPTGAATPSFIRRWSTNP